MSRRRQSENFERWCDEVDCSLHDEHAPIKQHHTEQLNCEHYDVQLCFDEQFTNWYSSFAEELSESHTQLCAMMFVLLPGM